MHKQWLLYAGRLSWDHDPLNSLLPLIGFTYWQYYRSRSRKCATKVMPLCVPVFSWINGSPLSWRAWDRGTACATCTGWRYANFTIGGNEDVKEERDVCAFCFILQPMPSFPLQRHHIEQSFKKWMIEWRIRHPTKVKEALTSLFCLGKSSHNDVWQEEGKPEVWPH